MAKEPTTGTELTISEKIEKWQKQYGKGNIHVFTVHDPKTSEKYVCYMRPATMADISRALNIGKRMQSDPFATPKSIWENCRLEAPEQVMNSDAMLLGLYGKIEAVIDVADVDSAKI